MKKTNILVLILVLLLVPMLSLYSCDKEVVAKDGEFYGTVAYVSAHKQSSDTPRSFVYLAPLGDESGIWVPFVVDGNADILTVGNKLKITYSGTALDGTMRRDGFVAESVELTEATKVTGQKNPLAISESYVFNRAESVLTQDFGTVVHVARIESGARGYFVYLSDADYNVGNLVCYWIDDNAIVPEDVASKLSSGESGYVLEVMGVANSPYESIDIDAAVSVSLKK